MPSGGPLQRRNGQTVRAMQAPRMACVVVCVTSLVGAAADMTPWWSRVLLHPPQAAAGVKPQTFCSSSLPSPRLCCGASGSCALCCGSHCRQRRLSDLQMMMVMMIVVSSRRAAWRQLMQQAAARGRPGPCYRDDSCIFYLYRSSDKSVIIVCVVVGDTIALRHGSGVHIGARDEM